MTTLQAEISADPGLYGPDSVTWRVHADPSMALGGMRALLLQALHPLAMAGVAQHSDYRTDPWGRLQRTAEYVAVTTFGSTVDAERLGARVQAVHRRLSGVEPESGRAYRVADPDLLLWVHCCEAESFLSTAVRSGLRLSAADQDGYYAEQTAQAALVGLDAADVPDSRQAVDDYFRAIRPQLHTTAEARRAVRFLLWPPMPAKVELGTPARPAWAALAAGGFAMLPRWARRAYRAPGLAVTDAGDTAVGFALRAGLVRLPTSVRHGPHTRAAYDRLGLT